MYKRLLGIDVDQVLVDAPWGDWLSNRGTDKEYDEFVTSYYDYLGSGSKIEYNLAEYYPSVENPMSFWKGLDYTGLPPIDGSVEALNKLKDYFDIIFISVEKGNHGHSKYDWLAKHFPYLTGYQATREKWLMNDSLVAMVDDRKKNLVKFDPHKRVLFDTIYKQEEEYDNLYVRTIPCWDDETVENICDWYL